MTTPHDLTVTTANVEDLTVHPDNPRIGDIKAIAKSLEENGQYQPIVVQASTGHVIVGNHRLHAAKQLGWDTIDTIMLDVDDDNARRIMLADNRTSDLGTYDDTALAALLQEIGVEGTGYTDQDVRDILNDLDGTDGGYTPPEYTDIAPMIQWEPRGPRPSYDQCLDTSVYDTLVAEIRTANLDPDLEQFLLAAASRHLRFDYQAIADLYPHLTGDEQRFFERSALVLIDVEDAIAHGYVRLTSALNEIFYGNHDDTTDPE